MRGAIYNFAKNIYHGLKRIIALFDLDEYRRRNNPDLVGFSDPTKIYFIVKKFLPSRGNTALDIGSNTGQYLNLFALRFARVIAFEPSKEAFDELKIKAGKYTNVELKNEGVFDINGTISVYKHQNSWRKKELSILEKANDGFGWGPVTEEININVIRIDDLNIPGIEFIKIDVEGSELKVLEGSIQTIDKCRPKLFIEIHAEELGNKIMQLLGKMYTFRIVRHPAYRLGTSLWRSHYFLFAVPRRPEYIGH